jgi:LEA14-like dessication related protein
MKKQIGVMIFLSILLIAGLSGCNDSTKSNGNSYDYHTFDFSTVKVTIHVDVDTNGFVNFSLLKIKFPDNIPTANNFKGVDVFNIGFTLYGNGIYAGEHVIESHKVLPSNLTLTWYEHFEIDTDHLSPVLSDAVVNSKEIRWNASGFFDILPLEYSIPIRVSFESESYTTG